MQIRKYASKIKQFAIILWLLPGERIRTKDNTHELTNLSHFMRIRVNSELRESLFGSWNLALLDFFH